MKQYIPRPGIVRTKICGVHVLIPSREAFAHCSTIQRLPLLWAATWDGLANGKTLEETVQFHRILTKKSEEEILQRLETFYAALCEKGFLIEVPDSEAEVSTQTSAETSAPVPAQTSAPVPAQNLPCQGEGDRAAVERSGSATAVPGEKEKTDCHNQSAGWSRNDKIAPHPVRQPDAHPEEPV